MVTVRYWAGAQEAAGRAEEQVAAGSLGDLLGELYDRPALARVLPACSLLLDGSALSRNDTGRGLPDGAVIDVLPPFAGG
ncbi:MAG TPA: MoaD/ThiS family protein [Mycobacteriales bacterium]|nr:MoaD/ThiS family protein [Mycobacteriales bacterium]